MTSSKFNYPGDGASLPKAFTLEGLGLQHKFWETQFSLQHPFMPYLLVGARTLWKYLFPEQKLRQLKERKSVGGLIHAHI